MISSTGFSIVGEGDSPIPPCRAGRSPWLCHHARSDDNARPRDGEYPRDTLAAPTPSNLGRAISSSESCESMATNAGIPELFENEAQLDDFMTEPSSLLVEKIREIASPLVILGAGGKMGPSLAVRAKRAAEQAGTDLRVVAVSRFSDSAGRQWLEQRGVETFPADLFDRRALANAPDSQNVVYLVGTKFGTATDPSRTWAVNTIVPINVAERYGHSRIVALSSGNIYPLVPASSAGSTEDAPLTPLGEYPNAAVARERMFEFHSRRDGTKVALMRLNYAVDMRYGVLVDIARLVAAGEPVDVSMGYLNCIWQGDANDMILRAIPLADSPPKVLNLTGLEKFSVRSLAERFGELFHKPVRIVGEEAETALLNDARATAELLGDPPTPIARVIEWTADWIKRDQPLWNKPTGFQVRDGVF